MSSILATVSISVSFRSIGLFVLWGLLAAVLLFLLLILIRFYRSFRKIMKIVDEKRSEIDQIIDELPGITKNVNNISTEVSHSMGAFHNTVDNVAHTSENVTGAIAEKSDSIGKVSSFMHTASVVKDLYKTHFGKEDTPEKDSQVMVCTPLSEENAGKKENQVFSKKEKENPPSSKKDA